MDPATQFAELLCVSETADVSRSLEGFHEVFVLNVYSSGVKVIMMHWQTHSVLLSRVLKETEEHHLVASSLQELIKT